MNNIDPSKYQVFVMHCPASLPLSFARHPWLVTNNKGEIGRWGVGWKPDIYNPTMQYGHIAKNALPSFQGLRVIHFYEKYKWEPRMMTCIEGGEGSTAQSMISLIESTPETYPYRDIYSFTGPNSNTYAQWVLDQFPELGLKLPWNAFGKSWRKES